MEKHERLRRARKSVFTTATKAAEALGIGASTYTHHENGTRSFDAEAAARYARKFKIRVEWLLFGTGDAAAGDGLASEDDGGLPVTGEVRAGQWLEIDQVDEIRERLPVMADRRISGRQYALRVVGDSMNRMFQPGSYVIIQDWTEIGIEGLRSGYIVVVRRQRAMTCETTLKRATRVKGGWNLYAESNNPKHKASIVLSEANNGEEIRIVGRAIGLYERLV